MTMMTDRINTEQLLQLESTYKYIYEFTVHKI